MPSGDETRGAMPQLTVTIRLDRVAQYRRASRLIIEALEY